MRRNIDAWWPLVGAGTVVAIVINASASACGVAVKDCGQALAADAAYADMARRISELAPDVSGLLPDIVTALERRPKKAPAGRLVPHPPAGISMASGCAAAWRRGGGRP